MKKNKDFIIDNEFNHRLEEKVVKKVIKTIKGCGFGELLEVFKVSSDYDRLHYIYKNLLIFEKAMVLVSRKDTFAKISDLVPMAYAFQIIKSGHYSVEKKYWKEAKEDDRFDRLLNWFNANIDYNPINHKSSLKNN